MRLTTVSIVFGAALVAASFSSVRAQQPANRTVLDGVYSAAQAKRGEALYADNCAVCHAPNLVGDVGPALAGKEFIGGWKDRTVGDLLETIQYTMPLTAPGSLTPAQSADVVSFVLSVNTFPAGTMDLPADMTPLKGVKFAEPGAASAGAAAAGAVAAGSGLYAEAQSKRGEVVYTDQCAVCHDSKLLGGVGPPLTGSDFIATWKGKTVGDLFEKVQTSMPLTSPGTLTPQQVADVVAFMLSVGHYPAGATEMATDLAALKAVPLGEPAPK